MKKHSIYSVFFFMMLVAVTGRAQLQVTLSSNTACPNEIITVNVSWPNTSISSLSLTGTPGASGTGNLGTSTTFTISHSQVAANNFTLCGTGTNINGPTTSCIQFPLTVNSAPTLTFINQVAYCPGGTATIETTPGGNYYTVTAGPVNLGSYQNNVFTIPNLSAAHSGTYQIKSIGSCTSSGVFTIAVAPSVVLTANTGSNVCENAPSVNLIATMSSGTAKDWMWKDPSGTVIANLPGTTVSGPIKTTDQGTYTVTASQTYGFAGNTYTTECPKVATTFINVVATSPVIITPAPGSDVCQGGKLGLAAAVSKNISINWTGPNGFTSSSNSPTINPVAPSNAGTYSVVALFTNNYTTCATSSSINITVVPVTVPVVSMPDEVCQGSNFSFSVSGGPNVSEFEWFGPGYTSKGQFPTMSNIQPGSSGTYYVTAKYVGTSATCLSTSLPHQLVVVPINSISVIPPTPVCIPDNAFLNATSIGASQYTWAGPNNFVGSGPNITVYYPDVTASGIYTVTAFFGGGNIVCKNTASVSLKVNPILKFSLIDRQMSCYNSVVEVFGPSGANSYTWTSSTGFTSNSKDIKFASIQPKNAGTYTLAVNLGPCVTSGSTTIEVLTPIEFTLRPQGRTLCLGDTVTLEAGVTGGSENYAYSWNPPLYMDSPFGPFKQFVPLGTVQYNLIAHDIACPNYTIAYPFEVNVKQPPLPQLDLAATEGCAPLVLNIDPKIEKESAITTYDFGGTKQFQKEGAFTYTLSDAGTYNLTIYSKGHNGCLGKYDFPYPLTVRPSPGTDIYWSPEKPTTSDEIVFHSTSAYDPIIYQVWTFQGGVTTEVLPDSLISNTGIDTTNNSSPKRRYEKFGKYPVMLVTQNDQMCFDTVVKYLDVIDDMNVYIPNAFTPNDDGINDVFGVKGQGMKSESFLMELFNRAGTLMFSTKDINEAWDGTYRGQKVKDGVYTYQIKVVGMNGEGRKEYVGQFTLVR